MLDEIFTTVGATFLMTGAKLVPALISRLSGASSTVTFGGEFVLATATPGCVSNTIDRHPTIAPENLFIIPVKFTINPILVANFTLKLRSVKA